MVNEITTGSYHLKRICNLIKEYQELEKDEAYIKIPLTKDEWDFIYMRLKDY